MKRAPLIGIVALGLLAAGCGGDDDGSSDSNGGSRTAAQGTAAGENAPSGGAKQGGGANPKPTGVVVKTAESQFGSILFDGKDRAIYLFDKEGGPRSECYGACAAAWPPVLTDGDPRARGAVKAGMLGTIERRDGSTQVTYAGRPLYYYVDDPRGEVLCHNVEEFGGLWLVLTPDGSAVG